MIPKEHLENFLKLPYRLRGKFTDSLAGEYFFNSEKIGCVRGFIDTPDSFFYDVKNWDKTVYMPFEEIEIPCPFDWNNWLTVLYGDWKKNIITHFHAKVYSTDIPYTEYYKMSPPMM